VTELLLLSNSTSPGLAFLEHALAKISGLVPAGAQLVFVPFAGRDHDRYTQVMAQALAPISVRVTGAHQVSDPARAVAGCDAVFVGGGNSFRLLCALQDTGLGPAIADQVRARAALPRVERGHQHGLSHPPHDQRHAHRGARLLPGPWPDPVPDQPALPGP
jgi:peptidase E